MIKKLESALNITVIIIIFALVNTANGDVCISNNVIRCDNYTSYAYCTIYQNNLGMINAAITLCSAGSFSQFTIYIDISLQTTTIVITLNLANNIQTIYLNSYSGNFQPVYLIASQSYPNITSMYLYYLSIYNSDNLLDNFPKMTNIDVHSSYFNAGPKLSKLKELTRIYMYYYSSLNITVDKEWVGGLSRLRTLILYKCGIQNITTDAFENLTSLTYLNLNRNNILELVPNLFRDLTVLKELYLSRNRYDIKIPFDSKNNNAFSPLKQLTSLSLWFTKIIPYDAFSTINSIRTLYLSLTIGIVPSTPFQHLHNLTYLSISEPFSSSLICNCSMQWASIIGKFGIYIDFWGGLCRDGGHVTDSSLYTECAITESYQCFNKTVACKNTCINTPDSYICACDVGYGLSLIEAETACHDIDECLLNTSRCEQKCRNTLGSYQCYCDSGYRLSADLISCTDINECNMSSWNKCEQHQCMNEVGSYICTCNPGYQLAGDGYSCYDLDECSNASLNTCNQHTCINELGTYTCCCRQGYKLTTNGKNCEDIDECTLDELNICGSHQCMNEQGSYRCICYDGYELALNNISCYDTDECMDANNGCNPHDCLNLVGSYTCSCGEGYNLTTNATNCEDINECNSPVLNKCDQHECVNKNGSYTCNCQNGYQLIVDEERRSCKDIDECQYTNMCEQRCVNTLGSYECACNDGFTLSPVESGKREQSFNCQDINECQLNSNPCSQLCINTNGSYNCELNEALSSSLAYTEVTSLISKLISVIIFLVVIVFASIVLNFSLIFAIIYMRNQRKKFVKPHTNYIPEMAETIDYIEIDAVLPISTQNQQNLEISSHQLSSNFTPHQQNDAGLNISVNNIQETSYENLADLPLNLYHNPVFYETS